MSEKKGQTLGFGENFALGGAAAIISKTAAAPIERVKLLVQNQAEMIKQGTLDAPYKGIMDCTMRTMQTEGLASFWRGNLPNCIRYFPTQALNLSFKDKIKALVNPQKTDSYGLAFGKNLMSGGLAGGASLFLVYSLDFARTRLANDMKSSKKGGAREFNGLIDVYSKTLKSDGVAGLYRGFMISLVGIIVYRGFYFGLYDTLKPIFLGSEASFYSSLALAYGVTVTSGILSYPVDTIRRRMMMTSGQAVKYKNSMHCAMEIISKEGALSLFKGAGANILRGVAGAGVLSGFDEFKKIYIAYRAQPTA